jgi:hypothetical protein
MSVYCLQTVVIKQVNSNVVQKGGGTVVVSGGQVLTPGQIVVSQSPGSQQVSYDFITIKAKIK